MSGRIDPLFENHPEVVSERQSAAEFIETLVLEQMRSLQGDALDAYLREMGLNPAELLTSCPLSRPNREPGK